ncbi:MAG: type II secretion system major pseudopilin GspG [Gammaproteobacteria bacterium]
MRRVRPVALHNSGFTLLELLVVLAILAMIAGFAAPQVFKFLAGAKSDSAKVQIETLSNSIDMYRLEVGSLPPNLEALVEKPSSASRWNGPYLKKPVIPKDPWGNEFVYRTPGEHGEFDIYSLGADATEGGEGENQDVTSWE